MSAWDWISGCLGGLALIGVGYGWVCWMIRRAEYEEEEF